MFRFSSRIWGKRSPANSSLCLGYVRIMCSSRYLPTAPLWFLCLIWACANAWRCLARGTACSPRLPSCASSSHCNSFRCCCATRRHMFWEAAPSLNILQYNSQLRAKIEPLDLQATSKIRSRFWRTVYPNRQGLTIQYLIFTPNLIYLSYKAVRRYRLGRAGLGGRTCWMNKESIWRRIWRRASPNYTSLRASWSSCS